VFKRAASFRPLPVFETRGGTLNTAPRELINQMRPLAGRRNAELHANEHIRRLRQNWTLNRSTNSV
jgi:hypothetical protein